MSWKANLSGAGTLALCLAFVFGINSSDAENISTRAQPVDPSKPTTTASLEQSKEETREAIVERMSQQYGEEITLQEAARLDCRPVSRFSTPCYYLEARKATAHERSLGRVGVEYVRYGSIEIQGLKYTLNMMVSTGDFFIEKT